MTLFETTPISQIFESHDPNGFTTAKNRWLLGEWGALADIDKNSITDHPDRAQIALLVAAAHQQSGDHGNARAWVRMSLRWGGRRRDIAHILLASAHNTLGRAAALLGNESDTTSHFRHAISPICIDQEVMLLGHARSVKELIRLSFFRKAVMRIEALLEQLKEEHIHLDTAINFANFLDMEIDWLRERTSCSAPASALLNETVPEIPTQTISHRSLHSVITPASSLKANRNYYGLAALDRKLEKYIPYDHGFFVELGANDGLAQSNTKYFEDSKHWHGVLIEPILHNYLKCKKNRSKSNKFYCAACVSFEYKMPYVSLTYSNLMTSPSGLESDIENPVKHAESGVAYLLDGEEPTEVLARAQTLSSLLDDAATPLVIDLLSLDVEGAEIEVLKGVDHEKYRFKYILIESRSLETVDMFLSSVGYRLLAQLSHHDYLFSGLDSLDISSQL